MAKARTHCGIRAPRYNLIILSLSFLVLFTAYNTLQNFVTSLLPAHLGNESLGVLYIVVCLTVFLAPVVVDRLGARPTMVLGAACFCVYLASLIHVQRLVVLAAAVVIGFGAAILWVAFGVYISKLSTHEHRGATTGFFWTVFQFCNIIGNLGAYFVFDDVSASWGFFVVFLAIGVVGTLLMLLLREARPEDLQAPDSTLQSAPQSVLSYGTQDERERDGDSDGDHGQSALPVREASGEAVVAHATVVESLTESFALMRRPVVLLLCPMFFLTGLELAFWTGAFPQLVSKASIGIVLTFSGVGEAAGGWGLGHISDFLGRARSVVLGTVLFMAGLALVVVLKESPTAFASIAGAPWGAYVAAFCFGAGDSVFNTQVYALMGDILSDSHSFTIFQLLQNLGSAVGFLYAIALPLKAGKGADSLAQVYVTAAVVVVATITFVMAARKARDDGQQAKQPAGAPLLPAQ